jgi:hypothetical protein
VKVVKIEKDEYAFQKYKYFNWTSFIIFFYNIFLTLTKKINITFIKSDREF